MARKKSIQSTLGALQPSVPLVSVGNERAAIEPAVVGDVSKSRLGSARNPPNVSMEDFDQTAQAAHV